jgi:predicted O-linked N-acetylglucosamine transferase (SPINDLY family)
MLGKILKRFSGDKSAAAAAQTAPPVTGLEGADLLIADGHHAEQAGDLLRACECYRKAVELAPRHASAHLNLGIGLEAIGNIEQACKSYEAALGIDPADVYANYNLGRQLFSRNALAAAEPLLRRAIDGSPDFADARVVLSRLKTRATSTARQPNLKARCAFARTTSAPCATTRICSLNCTVRATPLPHCAAQWRHSRAISMRTTRSRPCSSNWNSLPKRNNFSSSAAHLPGLSTCVLAGQSLLSRADRKATAEAEAALKLRPDWLDLLFDYGLILKRMARQTEAEAVFRRAIEIDRTYVRAYQMLGAVLVSQGRIQDALDIFGEGRKHCADTFDLESPEMFALNCKDDVSIDDLFARHVDFGNRLEQRHPARFASFENLPDPNRRLRIGFVSGDFQVHVVPLFLMPVLEERDRSAIEVYCYSTGDTADKFTERLRNLADVWRTTSRMPPDEIADLIHRDRIDILVDLAGHSGTPNLRIFALRPAPIQATWVGYLNTTGLSRIQYRISDNHSDPPGLTDRYHTEQLFRLPHSQWCYRPFVEIDYEHEAPVERNGYVTFGSFNQTVKITPAVRKLWGEILTQVPDSRLVVVGVVDDRAREDFHRDLESAGVSRDRITMVPYIPIEEYYRWFGRVDITLDTMPFSGGTTTCDALWMGAPVITCPGVRSWSRSAASILTTLGLTDWIAESPQDYVRRAVQLARNPARIAESRKSLRSRMIASPLMTSRFAVIWKTPFAACGRRGAVIPEVDDVEMVRFQRGGQIRGLAGLRNHQALPTRRAGFGFEESRPAAAKGARQPFCPHRSLCQGKHAEHLQEGATRQPGQVGNARRGLSPAVLRIIHA